MFIRKSNERGHFKNEWLESYHSFSFADYFDRKYMHFSDLRVLNHDFIAGNSGFPTHPHKNMEIITYVLQGELEHQDSLGNKTKIHANEIQVMSAGTGILHSESNPSQNTLELLQIWVLPQADGGTPGYAQKFISEFQGKDGIKTLVSKEGSHGSLKIKQDCTISSIELAPTAKTEIPLKANKCYWTQIAYGNVNINSNNLQKGDAIAFQKNEATHLHIQASTQSLLLLFELREQD